MKPVKQDQPIIELMIQPGVRAGKTEDVIHHLGIDMALHGDCSVVSIITKGKKVIISRIPPNSTEKQIEKIIRDLQKTL